jgi:DNA-3-methyladenine glycosylase
MSVTAASARACAAPPLTVGFFDRSVHEVARDLIGCTLTYGGVGGVIVETESYEADDPACHAFGGRTARNEVLFGPPALAYVYFSYGVHNMLNAVAEPEGQAAAVLIRALEPRHGLDEMRRRRGRRDAGELCSGPGKLTQALGVGLDVNGSSLLEPPFEVRGRDPGSSGVEIVAGPRIGISRAADLEWRFCAAGSRFLSHRAG